MNNLEYNKLFEYIRLLSCPVETQSPHDKKFDIFDDFLGDIALFWLKNKISGSDVVKLMNIAFSLDTIFKITPEEYDPLYHIYGVGFNYNGDKNDK